MKNPKLLCTERRIHAPGRDRVSTQVAISTLNASFEAKFPSRGYS